MNVDSLMAFDEMHLRVLGELAVELVKPLSIYLRSHGSPVKVPDWKGRKITPTLINEKRMTKGTINQLVLTLCPVKSQSRFFLKLC